MTTKTNLTIMQGETFIARFTWLDASEEAIDLTGYTARMQVRHSYADIDIYDPLVDITDEDAIALDNAGNIVITLADDVTEGIKAGDYVYDLELNLGGVVTKLLTGKVNVIPEVTR